MQTAATVEEEVEEVEEEVQTDTLPLHLQRLIVRLLEPLSPMPAVHLPA